MSEYVYFMSGSEIITTYPIPISKKFFKQEYSFFNKKYKDMREELKFIIVRSFKGKLEKSESLSYKEFISRIYF